jgi:osmotically-inducible protein OsmY
VDNQKGGRVMPLSSVEIERELERQADIHVTVEIEDGAIILSGLVASERAKEIAVEILSSLAPEAEIVDNLDISEVLPEEIGELSLSEAEVGDFPAATPNTWDKEALEPGDFTDQGILHNPTGAAGGGTAVDEEISEGEDVYVPPTDPVRDRQGEFLGGFQTTSMDEVEVARSALDGQPGDEAIAEAVRTELREDAATTDLEVHVRVTKGLVRVRGVVPTIEDSENVEEVAYRVPGVVEVIDELDVGTL